MSTLYSLLNPNEALPTQGIVEIIQLYDGPYSLISVDGQIISWQQKEEWEPEILKRKTIKAIAKVAKVVENQLLFVHVGLYFILFNDFDANDYWFEEDAYINMYDKLKDYLDNGGTVKPYHVKVLAQGVDELEEKI